MKQTAFHGYNLLAAVLVVLALLGVSGLPVAPLTLSPAPPAAAPPDAPPNPPGNGEPRSAPLAQSATFAFNPANVTIQPSQSVTANATLTNTGAADDTFTITTNVNTFPGWTANISTPTITIPAGESRTITFQITAPADAANDISLTAFATGQATSEVSAFLALDVQQRQIAIALTLVDPAQSPRDATPGSSVNFNLRVTNNGNTQETVTVRLSDVVRCEATVPNCNVSLSQTTFTLNSGGGSQDFVVNVILPLDAPVGAEATIGVIAEVGGQTRASRDVIVRVIEASPTPTSTGTPEPTQTPVPTLAPICRDRFEDDDSLGSARTIDVNLPQSQLETPEADDDDRRAICPAGDEDWLVFGAIEGKVYTIEVFQMSPGIDLSLELTDEDGNQLAFNDDFFNRDPNAPNPNDIAPRISQWRAPYTGRFYIRVRDVAERGGVDRIYRIELQDLSFGTTPTTVLEICADQFEPDGLPEQANLITSNELQREKRLCPTGDADWVQFFGRRNKRYFIYTDTRDYINSNPANPQAQAGADTVLILTDRDGLSVIDVNDDIPGGATLDSQIEFIPKVDGFYFAQVKNVGDVGNQFIRYNVVVELCIPGDDGCGRDISIAPIATPTVAPAATPTPEATPTLTPTVSDDEFNLDETPTPTPESYPNP